MQSIVDWVVSLSHGDWELKGKSNYLAFFFFFSFFRSGLLFHDIFGSVRLTHGLHQDLYKDTLVLHSLRSPLLLLLSGAWLWWSRGARLHLLLLLRVWPLQLVPRGGGCLWQQLHCHNAIRGYVRKTEESYQSYVKDVPPAYHRKTSCPLFYFRWWGPCR